MTADTADRAADLERRLLDREASENALRRELKEQQDAATHAARESAKCEENLREQLLRVESDVARAEKSMTELQTSKRVLEQEMHSLNLKWLEAEQKIARMNFLTEEAERVKEASEKSSKLEIATKDLECRNAIDDLTKKFEESERLLEGRNSSPLHPKIKFLKEF